MARIIETNDQALQQVDVDVVTLDLIENGLRNARYEMDEVLFRTALSPGIREQHDEFPLIADREGRMVVGQFGLSVPALLGRFDDTIEEGDVLLTSDPYACDAAISHANDWLIVTPIFHTGRLVGWAAMFGHMSDVGGKTPSSMPTDARTIYEEGVVIPPFKLYKKGQLNTDPLKIILNQVRQPEWNRADLNGLVAACRTAGRRVQEMCDRFGPDVYATALDQLLERNYRAMKSLLEMVFTDGETISFSDYICDDGVGYGPYKLTLSLTRRGEKVTLDFTGSSPQAAGPINYYINENLVKMFVGIYMITVADPQILWNDGFYPLIDVVIPDESFWKPKFPAALNARNHGIGRVFDLFGGLLGQTNPSLLNAAGFSSSPHFMYSGTYGEGDRKGEWFQLYSIGFGGIPGRPIGDGPDGHSLWPSFVNIPCEYLESYYPMRIEKWETVADTGGSGLHRGGNGVDVAYRFLEAGTIAIHDDRWLTYPWGVNGGEPGARGRKWIERADGTLEVVASKVHDLPVYRGDLLHFVTWGGGGWGDPLERPVDLVTLEVRRGLVSAEGARRYGVVCDEKGVADSAATDELRASLRADRPAVLPVFDMGPPMAQILERALEETGLPAPMALFPDERRLRSEPMTDRDAELDADYEGAGFGRTLELGRRPALLLIDLVRSYFEPGADLYMGGNDACLHAASELLAQARAAGILVVHTKVSYSAGGRDGGVFFRKVGALAQFVGDTELGAIMPEVAPAADEIVIAKQYASAFFGTSLIATLTSAGIDTVLIGGVSTSGCVRATAVDAIQHGFIPVVVREAVGDRDPRPHESNLFDLQAKYAEVLPAADVRTYLSTIEATR